MNAKRKHDSLEERLEAEAWAKAPVFPQLTEAQREFLRQQHEAWKLQRFEGQS